MLGLRTSNFQGATIRLIVPRNKHYCLYCSPVNFLLHASLKINRIILKCKLRKPNVKFEKQNTQNLLDTISIVYFLQTSMFTKTFSETSTIHPGIFHVWALWADSVSPQMGTIASCDQFTSIRIRENLVVNYNL